MAQGSLVADKTKTMTNSQMLYDVLASQQKAAGDYTRLAGEGEKSSLTDIFMIISEDDIKLAQSAISLMITNGWYSNRKAEQKDIIKTKQEYSKY